LNLLLLVLVLELVLERELIEIDTMIDERENKTHVEQRICVSEALIDISFKNAHDSSIIHSSRPLVD